MAASLVQGHLEGEGPVEPGHEPIATAWLMELRRLRPGIGFDDARARIAGYAADAARLGEISESVTATRLACCRERLETSRVG